ncbi:hypothetical protein RMB03_17395 [Acinetobacter sp. V91_7]|uniref:phage tail fiber protein n=1 Tax=unclassified Acinetobacter TaxID=196816 RepID=UPI00287E38EB|nr:MULTISPECIES: hypothetical protein [unclassified Acinetobacter]MDS7935668.1 hypothetical protein [Acinetobacter sp. V91_4B]MDS7964724.1 hypothetical protein [Acinetobacter sp. V91_7]MDS8025581.1 hypothetical protein [Acinetobacter sp. V91_13]
MSNYHDPGTLTSANAILQIRCKGIYDNFVKIQGFQADNAWSMGDANLTESRVGTDGKQAFGYTPHQVQWGIFLEVNSPSRRIFENIRKDFVRNKEARLVEIIVELPSIKERHTGSGTFASMSGGPNGKKLLDGTTYNFNIMTDGGEEMN